MIYYEYPKQNKKQPTGSLASAVFVLHHKLFAQEVKSVMDKITDNEDKMQLKDDQNETSLNYKETI